MKYVSYSNSNNNQQNKTDENINNKDEVKSKFEAFSLNENKNEKEIYENAISEIKTKKYLFINSLKESLQKIPFFGKYFNQAQAQDQEDIFNQNIVNSNNGVLNFNYLQKHFNFEKNIRNKDLDIENKNIKEWEKYYFLKKDVNLTKSLEENKDILSSIFHKLIINYGIPDIPNQYCEPDENYYKLHPDFLFCEDVEKVLIFFLQDKIRNKEIAMNYDSYVENIDEIRKLNKLKRQIESLKEKAKFNFELYQDYVKNQIDEKTKKDVDNVKTAKDILVNLKVQPSEAISKINEEVEKIDFNVEINKKIEDNFDSTQKQLYEEYNELTKIYNEKLRTVPNELSLVKDYFYFSDILQSANEGLLILNYGDFFFKNTFQVLDKDNISYYFILSVLLSEQKIWDKYNITEESLKNNINLLNDDFSIFPVEKISTLIKMRKEQENYQSLITKIDLDEIEKILFS